MREQDQAAEGQLAREARSTGEALARLGDLARITGNKPPAGHTLDDLEHLAEALKGWAFGLALGLGDDGELFSEFTGRPWIRPDGHVEPDSEAS
jgi:hypothetical protein